MKADVNRRTIDLLNVLGEGSEGGVNQAGQAMAHSSAEKCST